MRVFAVTPPTPVISVEEGKKHLRVLHDDEDTLIESYISAVCSHIDGVDGWLGRAIGEQTLEARFDAFAGQPLRLPYPPAIEIVSFNYIDVDGIEQWVDESNYTLLGQDLALAYGQAWPTARLEREAVRIRFTAGYETVPSAVRAALLLMLGDLYANRETSISGTISAKINMSTTVENLLAPFRVWA